MYRGGFGFGDNLYQIMSGNISGQNTLLQGDSAKLESSHVSESFPSTPVSQNAGMLQSSKAVTSTMKLPSMNIDVVKTNSGHFVSKRMVDPHFQPQPQPKMFPQTHVQGLAPHLSYGQQAHRYPHNMAEGQYSGAPPANLRNDFGPPVGPGPKEAAHFQYPQVDAQGQEEGLLNSEGGAKLGAKPTMGAKKPKAPTAGKAKKPSEFKPGDPAATQQNSLSQQYQYANPYGNLQSNPAGGFMAADSVQQDGALNRDKGNPARKAAATVANSKGKPPTSQGAQQLPNRPPQTGGGADEYYGYSNNDGYGEGDYGQYQQQQNEAYYHEEYGQEYGYDQQHWEESRGGYSQQEAYGQSPHTDSAFGYNHSQQAYPWNAPHAPAGKEYSTSSSNQPNWTGHDSSQQGGAGAPAKGDGNKKKKKESPPTNPTADQKFARSDKPNVQASSSPGEGADQKNLKDLADTMGAIRQFDLTCKQLEQSSWKIGIDLKSQLKYDYSNFTSTWQSQVVQLMQDLSEKDADKEKLITRKVQGLQQKVRQHLEQVMAMSASIKDKDSSSNKPKQAGKNKKESAITYQDDGQKSFPQQQQQHYQNNPNSQSSSNNPRGQQQGAGLNSQQQQQRFKDESGQFVQHGNHQQQQFAGGNNESEQQQQHAPQTTNPTNSSHQPQMRGMGSKMMISNDSVLQNNLATGAYGSYILNPYAAKQQHGQMNANMRNVNTTMPPQMPQQMAPQQMPQLPQVPQMPKKQDSEGRANLSNQSPPYKVDARDEWLPQEYDPNDPKVDPHASVQWPGEQGASAAGPALETGPQEADGLDSNSQSNQALGPQSQGSSLYSAFSGLTKYEPAGYLSNLALTAGLPSPGLNNPSVKKEVLPRPQANASKEPKDDTKVVPARTNFNLFLGKSAAQVVPKEKASEKKALPHKQSEEYSHEELELYSQENSYHSSRYSSKSKHEEGDRPPKDLRMSTTLEEQLPKPVDRPEGADKSSGEQEQEASKTSNHEHSQQLISAHSEPEEQSGQHGQQGQQGQQHEAQQSSEGSGSSPPTEELKEEETQKADVVPPGLSLPADRSTEKLDAPLETSPLPSAPLQTEGEQPTQPTHTEDSKFHQVQELAPISPEELPPRQESGPSRLEDLSKEKITADPASAPLLPLSSNPSDALRDANVPEPKALHDDVHDVYKDHDDDEAMKVASHAQHDVAAVLSISETLPSQPLPYPSLAPASTPTHEPLIADIQRSGVQETISVPPTINLSDNDGSKVPGHNSGLSSRDPKNFAVPEEPVQSDNNSSIINVAQVQTTSPDQTEKEKPTMRPETVSATQKGTQVPPPKQDSQDSKVAQAEPSSSNTKKTPPAAPARRSPQVEVPLSDMQIRRLYEAGQKAKGQILQICSKTIEAYANKKRNQKNEDFLSATENPENLPLILLCTSTQYSQLILKKLGRMKEVERIEVFYKLKPHLLELALDGIGKYVLHNLLSMSNLVTLTSQTSNSSPSSCSSSS